MDWSVQWVAIDNGVAFIMSIIILATIDPDTKLHLILLVQALTYNPVYIESARDSDHGFE